MPVRRLDHRPTLPRAGAATPSQPSAPAPRPPPSDFVRPRRGPALSADRAPVTSSAQAIERARALLEGAPERRESAEGTVVVADAPHVNDAADVSGARADAARTQLFDHLALEGTALEPLTTADRARYQAIKRALLAAPGDPVAALALQTLLLEGALPGDKALGGGATLLGQLAGLTKAELAAGVDRQALLADLVQEVAVPEAIAQRGRGTCAPTAIEIQLVHENPAEYVRLVAGLASPAGEVTTRGGDVLRRETDALTDDTGRSVPQRLLAPALMELGNGRADYDNQSDTHQGGSRDGDSGLTAAQADAVLESVYGHDFRYENLRGNRSRRFGVEFVLSELEAGRSVVVGLRWGDGGHKVLVVGTDTHDGQPCVRIVNPWGREELLRVEDFEARLRNVNYDARR
jgi:hypothetical protein